MNDHQDTVRATTATSLLRATAEELAGGFIHRLAPSFRPPGRLVCPSNEAEQAVVNAVTKLAAARGIPAEVIDLRPAPVERLNAVTERLEGWESSATNVGLDPTPTLLILCGFDVFGDDALDGPTYPFRAKFQFDRKFRWLFIGRDASRMRFLFGSQERPLYLAAGDITPENWQH